MNLDRHCGTERDRVQARHGSRCRIEVIDDREPEMGLECERIGHIALPDSNGPLATCTLIACVSCKLPSDAATLT